MTPQELQSKVLDYLSKNVDKGYCPRVEVSSARYEEYLNTYFYDITVYFICEIKADKEDVYHPDPVLETYDPVSDDLDCVLEYIASEIRMHEIEDNRRYDETGASY